MIRYAIFGGNFRILKGTTEAIDLWLMIDIFDKNPWNAANLKAKTAI